MRSILRQIKQANERKAQAIISHPEVRFMLQTLMGLHRARKEADQDALEKFLVQVDDYCGTIIGAQQNPLP